VYLVPFVQGSGLLNASVAVHMTVLGPTRAAGLPPNPKLDVRWGGEDVRQFEFPTLQVRCSVVRDTA
jgi:hypothetical protein